MTPRLTDWLEGCSHGVGRSMPSWAVAWAGAISIIDLETAIIIPHVPGPEIWLDLAGNWRELVRDLR